MGRAPGQNIMDSPGFCDSVGGNCSHLRQTGKSAGTPVFGKPVGPGQPPRGGLVAVSVQPSTFGRSSHLAPATSNPCRCAKGKKRGLSPRSRRGLPYPARQCLPQPVEAVAVPLPRRGDPTPPHRPRVVPLARHPPRPRQPPTLPASAGGNASRQRGTQKSQILSRKPTRPDPVRVLCSAQR